MDSAGDQALASRAKPIQSCFPLELVSSVHSLLCFLRAFDGFLLLLGLCQVMQG